MVATVEGEAGGGSRGGGVTGKILRIPKKKIRGNHHLTLPLPSLRILYLMCNHHTLQKYHDGTHRPSTYPLYKQ